MFGKCCRDTFVDDSDRSDMVIEVLCNQVCRRLPFVYDHTIWTVVVSFQVDIVSVTGAKTAVMLWTEFPRVPAQIWSTFILNMFIILRPLCREFNSL